MIRIFLICLLVAGAAKAGYAAVDSIGQASAQRLATVEAAR